MSLVIEPIGVDNPPLAAGQAALANDDASSFGSVIGELLAIASVAASTDDAAPGDQDVPPSDAPEEGAVAIDAAFLLVSLNPAGDPPPAFPPALADAAGSDADVEDRGAVEIETSVKPTVLPLPHAAAGPLTQARATDPAEVPGAGAPPIQAQAGGEAIVPDTHATAGAGEPAAVATGPDAADPALDAGPAAEAAPDRRRSDTDIDEAARREVAAGTATESRPLSQTRAHDDAVQAPRDAGPSATATTPEPASRKPARSAQPPAPDAIPRPEGSEPAPEAAVVKAIAPLAGAEPRGSLDAGSPDPGSADASPQSPSVRVDQDGTAPSIESTDAIPPAPAPVETLSGHQATHTEPPLTIAASQAREPGAVFAPAVVKAFAPPADGDEVVVPQLVRAMRLQMVNGVGEARLQLEPQHLGAVSIALRVEHGVVSAVVTAEQAGVRQWIETHESTLRQALAEQGLLLDKLQVQRDGQSPFDRSPREHDGPPPRRAPRRDTATFELLA